MTTEGASPKRTGGAAGTRTFVPETLRSAEIDARLAGMLLSLAVIWIGFHFLSGGPFLTPRNLWNLSVQTAVVAIMATGMVLIIVERHIDLSVGALMAASGMVMGLLQTIGCPARSASTTR